MGTNNAWNSQSPAQIVMGGTGQTTYTDGQLLIGNTSTSGLTKATLTSSDASVTITNGSGSIDLKAASAFPFTEVTGTNQTAAVNNGYITNNAARVGIEMPGTAALGSVVKVAGKGAGGWNLAPNGGQTLYSDGASVAYPGYFSSTSAHDCADTVTITANTEHDILCKNGTITPYVFDVAVGYQNAFYLNTAGNVWAWGNNSGGSFGNNTTTTTSSPVAMVGAHSFIAIASGLYHSLMLKADGSAWNSGINDAGQLGQQNITNYSSPVLVVGNHSFIQISTGQRNGDGSAYGLKVDGSLWAWGSNVAGQLGDGTTSNRSSPVLVVGSHSFKRVGGGETCCFALKADGTLWAWGINQYGVLGTGNTTSYSSPVQVIGGHSFVDIVPSALTNNGAIKADGSLWMWGRNDYGQLGDQTTTAKSSPVQVVGNHSFRSAVGSYANYYGLKEDGSCWAWGRGLLGNLGNNTTNNYSSPIQVVGSNFLYIGGRHPYKITSYCNWMGISKKPDGTLWVWGDGSSGTLGQITNTSGYSSPVVVTGYAP